MTWLLVHLGRWRLRMAARRATVRRRQSREALVRQVKLTASDDPAMDERVRQFLVAMDAVDARELPTAAARAKAILTVRDECDSLIEWIEVLSPAGRALAIPLGDDDAG